MSEIIVVLGEETPEGIKAGIAEQKALAKIEQDRQAARQAVLTKLGITLEELYALLG
jgi:uncharacterized protein with GYD domain